MEKARAVAGRAAVLDNLRVCWEGDTYGDNCGVCEKCIRTKLTFIAAGVGVIPALGPVTEEQVESIEVRALAQRLELKELLDYEADLGPDLATAVARVLRRYADADLP